MSRFTLDLGTLMAAKFGEGQSSRCDSGEIDYLVTREISQIKESSVTYRLYHIPDAANGSDKIEGEELYEREVPNDPAWRLQAMSDLVQEASAHAGESIDLEFDDL